MKKQDRKKLIRARAENCLADLYHNATPNYPRIKDNEAEIFENWFYDIANFEIMDFWRDHEIAEYGRVYSWGRGGKTIAPDDLIKTHGGSGFSINTEIAEEWPISKLIDLIRIIESFNSYVKTWNRAIPEMWQDWVNENPELFSDPIEEEFHI